MTSNDEVPLTTAAQQLGFPWGRAYNALLSGELKGRQVGRRWFVSSASLAAAKARLGAQR